MARGVINPLTGCTDGKLNQTLRSALRQVWSRTVKKTFINSVRYKKDGKFHVKCVSCGLEMAIADKKKPINKDGSVSKRRAQKLFDCDHTEGITSLSDPIYDLGAFWISLMTGALRILCKPCHASRTAEQTKKRNK
jgi:hypothetical protein